MSHGDAKLRHCVMLALPGQEPRNQLLRHLAGYLCSSSTATMGPRSCSALIAAEAIQGLPSDIRGLQDVLSGSFGSEVFRLHQDINQQVTIQLDTDALVQRARQATKTGILRHELPTPASYVDGVHPVRPGQRDCAQYVKFAECKFGRACAFNHPEPTYTCYPGSSGSRNSNTNQHLHLALPAEHTAASHPRSSSSSSLDHTNSTIHLASNLNMLYPSGSVNCSAALPGPRYHHTGAAATSVLSPYTAAAAATLEPESPPPPPPPPAPPPPPSPPLAAAAAATTVVPVLQAPLAPPPQPPTVAGSCDISSTSAPPAAPAAAAAVCPMFLTRGICLRGPQCSYSHPARGLPAATSQPIRSATPKSTSPPPRTPAAAAAAPLSVAVPSAASITGRPLGLRRVPELARLLTQAAAAAADASPSLHQQQQQPLEPLTWQQTALQCGHLSGTDHLHHQEQQQQQQQQSELLTRQQQALQTVVLPHAEQQQQQQSDPLTWQQQALQAHEPLHAEQQQQRRHHPSEDLHEQDQAYQSEQSLTWQQQQQQETITWQHQQQDNPPWHQQQGNVHQISRDSHHKGKQARLQNKHHMQDFRLYPVTGQTSEGNPHRPGAPNCPYYMHIGTCMYGLQCVYHHLDCPAQPLRYVRDGFAAGRWFKNRPVPNSRIVMHLSRIWDYDSCPEAQLKTWMARYLISVANPDCRMWGKTAAQPIAEDNSEETTGTHSGRYSCRLSEAGEYLQTMWHERPDEDVAASKMPYSDNLRALFSRDPYFLVKTDIKNSHMYVKLNVAKLVETLNW